MIAADTRGAWRDLAAQLRPFIARRVSAPADVDDVLQEVFLRMQRSLAGLRSDARFGPWVYQVARNAIADHHRARVRHPVACGDAGATEEPAPLADDDAVTDGLAACIAPFVARLPAPYRAALTLTELEGLPLKTAAEMLGLSLSGTKSRVQRGRERLRQMFEACCALAVDSRGRVIEYEPRPAGGCPIDCGPCGERPTRY